MLTTLKFRIRQEIDGKGYSYYYPQASNSRNKWFKRIWFDIGIKSNSFEDFDMDKTYELEQRTKAFFKYVHAKRVIQLWKEYLENKENSKTCKVKYIPVDI